MKAVAATSFVALLEAHRARYGISRSELAASAAVDHSYLQRVITGQRGVPRKEIVGALARALELRGRDLSDFSIAAGYLPPTLERYGAWPPVFDTVLAVLTTSDEDQANAFCNEIRYLAAHPLEYR